MQTRKVHQPGIDTNKKAKLLNVHPTYDLSDNIVSVTVWAAVTGIDNWLG
jgi:ADP-dependent phosphofructokinase/glucokinase